MTHITYRNLQNMLSWMEEVITFVETEALIRGIPKEDLQKNLFLIEKVVVSLHREDSHAKYIVQCTNPQIVFLYKTTLEARSKYLKIIQHKNIEDSGYSSGILPSSSPILEYIHNSKILLTPSLTN